jgi:hypothetical protein
MGQLSGPVPALADGFGGGLGDGGDMLISRGLWIGRQSCPRFGQDPDDIDAVEGTAYTRTLWALGFRPCCALHSQARAWVECPRCPMTATLHRPRYAVDVIRGHGAWAVRALAQHFGSWLPRSLTDPWLAFHDRPLNRSASKTCAPTALILPLGGSRRSLGHPSHPHRSACLQGSAARRASAVRWAGKAIAFGSESGPPCHRMHVSAGFSRLCAR